MGYQRFTWLGLVLGLALLVGACRPPSAAGYVSVSPIQLRGMLQDKDFLLVNVHIPYEGEIEGTDLHLPYDRIGENRDKLPQDKGAKIVVYCRSGNMSAQASSELVRLGYTRVYDLAGGMVAWQGAGYPLLRR